MLEEKVLEKKIKFVFFLLNQIFVLVTRVRSHGYVQLVFNVITKDIEPLGYTIQTKNSSLSSKQRSDNNHSSHQNQIHSESVY